METQSTSLNTIVLNGVFVLKDDNFQAVTAETTQFSIVISSPEETFTYRVLETLDGGQQKIELTDGSFIHSITIDGSDQTIPIDNIWVSQVTRGGEDYILFECTAQFNGQKQTLSLVVYGEGDLFANVQSAADWAALTPLIDYQGPVLMPGFREGDAVSISNMTVVSSDEVNATSYLIPGVFVDVDENYSGISAEQELFEFIRITDDTTFTYEVVSDYSWDDFSVYSIQENDGTIFNAVRIASTGDLVPIDRIWSSQVNTGDESYVLMELSGRYDGDLVNLFTVVYADGCYFSDIDSIEDWYGKTPTNDFQGPISVAGYRVGDVVDLSEWIVNYNCDVDDSSVPNSDNSDGSTIENKDGDDNFEGTTGIDLVVYTASKNDFTITNSAGVITITNGVETDTLANFERLKFSDGAIAFDIEDGNAGKTAKILGAVFGADSVENEVYAGIGIDYLDNGTSYENLMSLAIDVAIGAGADSATVVNHLYEKVVGVGPTSEQAQPFIDLLENGTYTKGSLGVLAAETALNIQNINLVGLVETGLDYLPVV